MRALVDISTGFSGNEVARTACMHPNSALKALALLEELGIVNRQIGGRDHIFSLNREHYLFQEVLVKVFQTEITFPQEIINTLASILKKLVYSAVIFGNAARGEKTALSDLDICCIVNALIDRIQVNNLLDKKSKTLNKKFGIKLAPIFFLKNNLLGKESQN